MNELQSIATNIVKPCPLCGVTLVERQDDCGGYWYEHPDFLPFQVSTEGNNYEKPKGCCLSHFQLGSRQVEQWNRRVKE